MAEPQQQNQVQDQKPNDKELNFRAFEAKYERQLAQERNALAQERAAREELERQLKQTQAMSANDDDESEPYVDHKKLKKEQAKFGQQLKQETQSDIQRAVNQAINEERKQNWIKSNPDFVDVLQLAEKFAQVNPDLAEAILEMPEGFERQKLVYKNIKALGLDRPESKPPSIQEKVDANKRSPYYQPSGVGTAPYSSSSDFSKNGQKQAYDKMQELKRRLSI